MAYNPVKTEKLLYTQCYSIIISKKERREMVLEEEGNKKYITELKNRIDDFSDSAKIAVLLNEVSHWHKAAEE